MIGLFILLCIYLNKKEKNKFEIYINASLIWTLTLLVVTYLWSALYRLNTLSAGCSYLVLNALLLFFLRKRWKNAGQKVRELVSHLRSWRTFVTFDRLLITGEVILAGVVFYYALKAYPYNWDSMTYHLARVVNWEQGQSVLPYATHIERQIASPVLGAYIHLLIYIFGGSRHEGMLNLLQCISCISNAVFLFGIARRLGVEKRWACLTPMIYICTPIVLAEATTTQVDNFATFWLLAFIYLLLPLVDSKYPLEWNVMTGKKIIQAALCVGIGYLAKPSICIAMLLFLVWLLLSCLNRKTKLMVMVRYVFLAISVLIFAIAPSAAINFTSFGKLSHPAVGQRQLIGTFRPNFVAVNFLKNFMFNFASSEIEMTRVVIERVLYYIANLFGLDLNDPVISEDGMVFGFPDFPARNCDSAINMFLVVTTLFMAVWFICRNKKQSVLMKGFSIYALGSFIVFCSVLRWERYINRYMIAYFALLSVFIVIQIFDMVQVLKGTRGYLLSYFVMVVVVAGSLINYCLEIRYLQMVSPFSKERGYFAYNGEIKEAYSEMTEAIRQSESRKLGLKIGGNTYEYPIWSMLGEDYEIRHIMVENSTGKFEKRDFTPDCILFEKFRESCIQYQNEIYDLSWTSSDGNFGLYFLRQ